MASKAKNGLGSPWAPTRRRFLHDKASSIPKQFSDNKIVLYPNPDEVTRIDGTVLSWLTCVVNNNSPQEGFVRVSPQKSVRKSSLKLLCTGGNRPQDVSLVLAENPAVF